MKTKCIACDGYGTRPHRSKPSKVVKCRVCSGLGYEVEFAPFPIVPIQPLVPTVPIVPPWIDPVRPMDPLHPIQPMDPIQPIGPWFMPQTYCGVIGGLGGSGGNA